MHKSGRRKWAVAFGIALMGWLVFACKHGGQEPNATSTPPADTSATSGDASLAAASTDDSSVDLPTAMPNDLVEDAGAPEAAAAAQPPPDFTPPPGYPAASLKETFSKSAAKLKACYQAGKKRDSKLRGKVIVKFSINSGGRSTFAANEGSNLPDDAVIACVVRVVKSLHYTKPLEGSVTVIYPFIFHPGDETLILPDSAPPPK
jgi:hypothetical protein